MTPVFTFKQVDGKWTSLINGEYLAYMQQTKGVPAEVMIETINGKTKLEKIALVTDSWAKFTKENNIDTTPYKQELLDKKEEVMSLLTK